MQHHAPSACQDVGQRVMEGLAELRRARQQLGLRPNSCGGGRPPPQAA
jgi:hypothetical protein